MEIATLGVDVLVKSTTLVWQISQDQLQLASDADRELYILKEFKGNIGRLLNEAYPREVTCERLNPSIKRIREFLFDSEDAIEDLRQRESRGNSSLRHFYNNRTFTVEARDIKQRWEDYAANLGATAPIEPNFGITRNHARSTSAGLGSLSNAFVGKTDALVGIEEPMNQLVQLLTENPLTPKMIFVHGEQGVGKTSLVAAVLSHQSVRNHFKYCVWIEDLRSLADNTKAELMKANATMWDLTMEEVNNQGRPVELGKAQGSPVKLQAVGLRDAFKFIKKHIKSTADGFSWALVLDDVVRADVFEILQDQLCETRPSVLVTTRVSSLSSSSSGHVSAQYVPKDFEHVFLSENDSRSLFFREMEDTYKNLRSKCEKSPTLKDASDHILRKCKGLPLAILATSNLVKYNKKHDVTGDSDAVQLEKMSDRLEEELLFRWHEVGPNGKMIALRMDHLFDIRDYLFYLSIFPLHCPIKCSTLMRLWMAVEQGMGHNKAKITLQKLLQYNVIRGKKTGYGKVKTSRVHNLLHQIIISKSNEEEFAMIVANPEGRLPENVRHLSFHSPMGKIDDGTSVQRLRSLHVFKEVYGKSLKKLLEEVERLKVLHIQRHLTMEEEKHPPPSLHKFPQKILRSKYLRYLSLRGSDVDKIPEGIKYLAYLESLDLRDTLVNELPEGISQLTELRHLLVSKSKRNRIADADPKLGVRSNRSQAAEYDLELGVKAPSKLGHLTLLQKLCMIELKPDKCEREKLLQELGKLTDLQRLGLSKLESRDADFLCTSIEKLTNLVALRLIAVPGQKINLSKVDMGKTPNRLQRVHLTGCLETLPEWMLRYDILVKLVLKGSQLTVDALQQLGELPSLKHLELEQAFDVIDMKFRAEKFQELRFLGLDKFDRLESIEVDAGALPILERLSLARCNSLTTVPPFITHHTKLKCLELWDMPEEFDIAIKVIIKGLCNHIKVKSKKWKDPVVEGVKSLPVRGTRISSPLPPFRK